jgi:hypothetical protein
MRLYHGNKILLNVRLPFIWRKPLLAKAKEAKTTVSKLISDSLEKKYRYGGIDKSDAKF